MRGWSVVAGVWLAGWVAAGPLDAQRLLKGRVISEATRLPLSQADISILEVAGATARTGNDGAFQIEVPTGAYRVQIRRIGYEAKAFRIRTRSDTLEVEFSLKPLPVTLDSVSVTGKGPSALSPRLADFERRRKISAGGQFLGPDELAAQADRRLGDALRHLRGLRITPLGSFGQTVSSMRGGFGGGTCYLPVWLDGILVSTPGRPYDLERHRVDDLMGIEVYTGLADTPVEFGVVGTTCGALVLWTRDRPRHQ